MTDPAYARLLAEEIPTRPQPQPHHPWTPEEQEQHRTDLLAALNEPTPAPHPAA